MRVREHYESFRTFFLRTGKTSYLRTGKTSYLRTGKASYLRTGKKSFLQAGKINREATILDPFGTVYGIRTGHFYEQVWEMDLSVRRKGIAGKIYFHNLLLVLTAVVLTGAVSLYMAVSSRNRELDTQILDISSMVGRMQIVREALESGSPRGPYYRRLTEELDMVLGANSRIDIIVVCDRDSIRYYHNSHDQIGRHFQGDDQERILEGHAPYISEAEGTLGMQRRAFYPVTDDQGETIGFVMASVLTSSIFRSYGRLVAAYLVLVLVLLAAGALLAAAFMQSLTGTLLGYQPEELARRFIERTEVMDAMEEGICAVDASNRIIFINNAARSIFGTPSGENVEGRALQEVFPMEKMHRIIRTSRAEYNVEEKIRDNHILSTRIPIRNDDRLIGAVSIMRDRTEVTHLAEELTGVNYMLDSLRALQHEFKNKMHVILGFLEMDRPDQARAYILGTSLVSGEAVSAITKLIPISNLAALLIGKVMRASELGIRFILKQDSFFVEKEGLPTDCYITIIGNLVENAIDELNSRDYPVKEIELGIYADKDSTMIVCDDTGGGIPEDILVKLYDRSTSTKGEGHGIGFSLIREIVDNYEGMIHIDTEPGMGTSIEITLPI